MMRTSLKIIGYILGYLWLVFVSIGLINSIGGRYFPDSKIVSMVQPLVVSIRSHRSPILITTWFVGLLIIIFVVYHVARENAKSRGGNNFNLILLFVRYLITFLLCEILVEAYFTLEDSEMVLVVISLTVCVNYIYSFLKYTLCAIIIIIKEWLQKKII